MTRAARIYVTVTKSSNFATKSPFFSRDKAMPDMITTTILTATGQGMTEPTPTTTTTGKAEMRLHAGNTTEHINGKDCPYN